jgi:alkanesulfonate monooxygenase SsuD/methylene tetrahydromethanopterin reductase-like flavin-dependent oxidoreductase (luciferase family)
MIAEHADGWNAFAPPVDFYQHKLSVLEGHCRDVGRDPAEIRRQIVLSALLGADRAEVEERSRAEGHGTDIAGTRHSPPQDPRWSCTTEDLVKELAPFVELGVTDFLLLARPPADMRTIGLFAQQVAPALREIANSFR